MARDTEKPEIVKLGRILALEIRSRRFGFVVIEDAAQLLDWGVRRHDLGGSLPSAATRIASLMQLYEPGIVIIRRGQKPSHPASTVCTTAYIIQEIRAEARRHSAVVHLVGAERVRAFFAEHGGTAKHEIASVLAQRFTELAWKAPLKRKAWEGEYYLTAAFDAAAAAVTFLSQYRVGSL